MINKEGYSLDKIYKLQKLEGFMAILNSGLITDEIRNAIVEAFQENDNEDSFNIRQCNNCGKYFVEGYCIEGIDYYCSDECLFKNMYQEQYDDLYDEGNGDSYWTDYIYF